MCFVCVKDNHAAQRTHSTTEWPAASCVWTKSVSECVCTCISAQHPDLQMCLRGWAVSWWSQQQNYWCSVAGHFQLPKYAWAASWLSSGSQWGTGWVGAGGAQNDAAWFHWHVHMWAAVHQYQDLRVIQALFTDWVSQKWVWTGSGSEPINSGT